MPRATLKLPRWANVAFQHDDKHDKTLQSLSIEEEEAYLRTRTLHSLTRRVDDAVRQAMDTQLAPLVEELFDFFAMASPTRQQEPPTRKRPRSDASSFVMDPPRRYPPTLLPMALLKGPLSCLDRQEMIRHLIQICRDKSRSPRNEKPATCYLRNVGKAKVRDTSTLMHEILRQCIEQDPDARIFHRLLFRTKTSFSQALLTWAGNTESFDSVIIVIEGAEGMSTLLLQDFIQLLTNLRSEHGLPLHIVLVSPPAERGKQLQLRSSAQGMIGLLLREFVLPSSQVLYDGIHQLIWVDRPLPVVLPRTILQTMRESFVNHHSSVILAVAMLKQSLCLYMSQPGSFLMGYESQVFPEEERDRMEWFCSDREARNVALRDEHEEITGQALQIRLSEIGTSKRSLVAIMRMLGRICHELNRRGLSGLEWAELSFAPRIYNHRLHPAITKQFRESSLQENLVRLAKLRADMQCASLVAVTVENGHDERPDGRSPVEVAVIPPDLHHLSESLNELIVLVGKSAEAKKFGFMTELSMMFEEWVYDVSRTGSSLLLTLTESRGCGNNKGSGIVRSLVPQTRKSLAGALIQGPSVDEDGDGLYFPCVLFSLISEYVIISREEWFRLFLERCHGEKTLNELWCLFAIGVRQLEICGLIREKSGQSKAERLYEKTALVWCSSE